MALRERTREALRYRLYRSPWLYRAATVVRRDPDHDRRVLLGTVETGDRVLDVGAHVGRHALLLSHRVGPDGRVTAFEPATNTADRLRRHLAHHGRHRNVRVVQAALAEQDGVATLHRPGDDHGHASLEPHRHGAWNRGEPIHRETVPVTTLDLWATAAHPGVVHFVKMDVEGAELATLRGGVGLITTHRPLLYLEVYADWTRSFGYRPADLVHFLAGLGYDRWLRAAHGRLSPLTADLGGVVRSLTDSPSNLLCWRSDDPEHLRRLRRLGPSV